MAWVSLCELAELTEGEGKYAEVDGYQLAVFLWKGVVYAIDNHCPHAGGNMAGGYVDDGCAVCPWHGWAFHLTSGELRDSGATMVNTYPVRVLPRDDLPPMVQADLPMP